METDQGWRNRRSNGIGQVFGGWNWGGGKANHYEWTIGTKLWLKLRAPAPASNGAEAGGTLIKGQTAKEGLH